MTENVKRRRPATTATFELSFQSRVGPVKWLEPYPIPNWRRLVRYADWWSCRHFVSEHIETLEELGLDIGKSPKKRRQAPAARACFEP